jgi:hypothetical protein
MNKEEVRNVYKVLRSLGFSVSDVRDALPIIDAGDGSKIAVYGEFDESRFSVTDFGEASYIISYRVSGNLFVLFAMPERNIDNEYCDTEIFISTPNGKFVDLWDNDLVEKLDSTKANIVTWFYDDEEAEVILGSELMGSLSDIPDDWWVSREVTVTPEIDMDDDDEEFDPWDTIARLRAGALDLEDMFE